uniref:Sec-independent protein translocase protein TatC n=1 Tax=Thermogemmatispora argillosa TaxID=2045280 RepID=A0A455T1P4_9CHLR|nr:Sec-independent protein translocase protein TatC [Thermogemmatispora argillosa]
MATGNLQRPDLMPDLDETFRLEEEEEDGASMTLVEHLEELRWRIFKSLIAVVVGAVVAFIFREPILRFLTLPLPRLSDSLRLGPHGELAGKGLITIGLAEGFTVFLKVSIAVGILLAMPVILYQAWAFIAPGLYRHEKRAALPFLIMGSILFVAGIALGFVVLQYPVQWLIAFSAGDFVELVSADSYFTFVAFFLLAFGIVFEIPLVLTFLAKLGVVNVETLKRRRAAAHVGLWIASTFLTPGADFYSPIILGVTMSCLYELTILLIRFMVRPSQAGT